jgi:hypothetical protein
MRTRQGRPVRSTSPWWIAVCALSVVVARPARAADPDPFAARAGLDVARAAAASWAPDAALIYVENDEPVGSDGAAGRWGYLYYSASLDRARVYSVRGGKIVVAENLDMRFEAPPLATDWIDSGAARQEADRVAASTFRKSGTATLATMLLVRGAFQDKDPDATTWTLVYTAPGAPSLFVMVDASGGKVRRTWRG